MAAYLGTTVAGFPNFFILTGPNTGLGHTSLLVMIESQLAYVLDRRSARTVWESGCKSWYLDSAGRNRTLWPDFTFKFRLKTRRFDLERYVCQPLQG